MTVYVLNSPVMTNYGRFEHRRVEENEAIEWLRRNDRTWQSAVGHAGTAYFMTQRLGIAVPFHKMSVRMVPGDEALILRILRRLPDSCSLSVYEIQHTPCEFSVVRMLADGENENNVRDKHAVTGRAG